jgi:predicted nuclease of predicted toxin-antitoxin system
VRLLLDHNIPPQASDWLKDFDVNCLHVRDASLKAASDRRIWEFARLDDRVILAKDGDFAALAKTNTPERVRPVWLRVGNLRNKDFEPWLIAKWSLARELLDNGHSIIELR